MIRYDIERNATAAAEAGEPIEDMRHAMIWHKGEADRLRTELAATIERCAQAAKDHLKLLHPDENVDEEAESVAAAIRAMKD